MDTPICDFVKEYASRDPLRLHMPGHKGRGALGFEPLDITEITGADVLYHADGIIRRSEENASRLFGSSKTIYSCEGSSLSIRAMLYLTALYARSKGSRPAVLAARNAHKVFITAAALLDVDVRWMFPAENSGIVSCVIEPAELEAALAGMDVLPTAVYITSPDYLGSISDIRGLAAVCRRYGVLLLVDNAHGAYLRFLPHSLHPLDLGADMCCDSAHKTLPVVTGGAYLHISEHAPEMLCAYAEQAMALFASTSPSYLILQSLDAANAVLEGSFGRSLEKSAALARSMKDTLLAAGYDLCSDEPIKLTLMPRSRGYTGEELAAELEKNNIYVEFADPDYLVLMLPPEPDARILQAAGILAALPRRSRSIPAAPRLPAPQRALDPHSVLMLPCRELPVEESIGRVMAAPAVSCPPAIPIVSMGEVITREAADLMRYYGIDTVTVIIP